MNSAMRVYDIITELQNFRDQSMIKAYKTIFKLDNDISVYKALILLDDEINDINYAISHFDIPEAQFVKDSLHQLTASSNFHNSVNAHIKDLLRARDFISMLKKPLPKEKDIKEELIAIQIDLDNFLEKIINLDISETDKLLYHKITYQLKESISFYAISGEKGLNIPLRAFGCITKKNEEAQTIFKKIMNYTGFTSDGIAIAETITKFLPQ